MNVTETLSKYPHLADSYKDITEYPFKCPNCNAAIDREGMKEMYCSPQCKEMAKAIRYERKCRADGRYERSDVQDAIRTKIAFLLSDAGYYDSKARVIPDEVRKTVIERDKVCIMCGKEANEIDHVSGDSRKLDNLQLLCHECHTIKTQTNFEPYIYGIDKQKDIIIDEYERRTLPEKPARLCDIDEWGSLWPEVRKERKMSYYTKVLEPRLYVDKNFVRHDIEDISYGVSGFPKSIKQTVFANRPERIRITSVSQLEELLNELDDEYLDSLDDGMTEFVPGMGSTTYQDLVDNGIMTSDEALSEMDQDDLE